MKIYQCTRCGKISLTIREANKHILSDEGKKNGCIGSRVLHAIHLPLKAEWYDMVERGEKKEEYRLLSCHWLKHLCYNWQIGERWDECKGGRRLPLWLYQAVYGVEHRRNQHRARSHRVGRTGEQGNVYH